MGGWFLYRNAKQKQKLAAFEKSQLRQKLLLSQMNPHFVFNSIDNIKSLIYNKKDDQAVNYLTKFSKLMRQILEHSNENYIALMKKSHCLKITYRFNNFCTTTNSNLPSMSR
jgi:sensor histidine kinase YesM